MQMLMNVWELSDSCHLVNLNFSIAYTCTINLHNIEDDGHRGTYEEMVRITVFEWYLTGEQRTFACTPYHMCINPRAALSHRKWRPFLYWLDWWCSHTFRLSQNIYNTIIYELRLTFVDPPKYLWDKSLWEITSNINHFTHILLKVQRLFKAVWSQTRGDIWLTLKFNLYLYNHVMCESYSFQI